MRARDARLRDGRGPQRARAGARSRRARRSSCWPRPSASPRRPSGARWRRAGGAVRGRRGPLRGGVGPRLPPRLPAPARRDRALRPPAGDGRHGHRHAAGGGGDRATRLGLRDPVSVRSGFDRPNLDLRRRRRRGQGRDGAQAGGPDARARASRARRPAIVYCGTRKDTDAVAERARGARASRRWPTTPACPRSSGRAARRRSWTAAPRWSWRPTRSGWAWTRPTCARSCTGRCRRASRPTTRRRAAAGATGSRRGRCCWRLASTWAG